MHSPHGCKAPTFSDGILLKVGNTEGHSNCRRMWQTYSSSGAPTRPSQGHAQRPAHSVGILRCRVQFKRRIAQCCSSLPLHIVCSGALRPSKSYLFFGLARLVCCLAGKPLQTIVVGALLFGVRNIPITLKG